MTKPTVGGNTAAAGQKFPMTIVVVHGNAVSSVVNGQVMLDGTDVYWATSVGQDDSGKPGTFAFPVIEAPKVTAPKAAPAKPEDALVATPVAPETK